jgi:hypothetical protein
MLILAKALPIILIAIAIYLAITAAYWLYNRYPTRTQRDRLIFIAVILVAVVIALIL